MATTGSGSFYDDLMEESKFAESSNIKITANDIKEKIYTDLGISEALDDEIIDQAYKEEVISLTSKEISGKEKKDSALGSLFNKAFDQIQKDKENPIEDDIEEYDEVEDVKQEAIEESKPKEDDLLNPKLKEKKYNFTEEELRIARIGLLKKSGVVKHWTFQNVLNVTLQSLSDIKVRALNNYYNTEILNKGERRTVVKFLDPYTDPETKQFIPGGRIEETVYINPDHTRLASRSTLAALIQSIDNQAMPEIGFENGEEALKKRIALLEEYNSQFLDKLYNEIAVPFLALVEEASEKLLNF